MSTAYYIAIIAAVAVCTFLIRLCPFIVFGRGSETPKNVLFIGNVLPTAMITILIVYCFKTIDFSNANTYVPQLISGILVAVLHFWKNSTLLSIGVGTVCYMILTRTIFI